MTGVTKLRKNFDQQIPRMLRPDRELGSSQRSSFFDAVVEDRDGRVSYERIER